MNLYFNYNLRVYFLELYCCSKLYTFQINLSCVTSTINYKFYTCSAYKNFKKINCFFRLVQRRALFKRL